MNKELDLNLNSLVTEVNSIEIKNYGTIESDLFVDINFSEIPNTACWNKFEAKDEYLSEFSIKGDYPQDEAGIFFHGDAKIENTLRVLTRQEENLIETRSNLELESGTILTSNEEYLENNYCTINGEFVEERMGLNLEDNELSFGTFLEGFGTIDANLFGGDKLEVKDTFLHNNSIGEVGISPLNDFPEHHISKDTNTLFINKPVTASFSTKHQDVYSKGNSDLGAVASKNIFDSKASTYSGLDTLKGLQIESPYTFADYQNGVIDIGATYEHEEVIVKDIGNSLRSADNIHLATLKTSQVYDEKIHFEGINHMFEDEVVSGNNLVNFFPDLKSSMANSYQVFQIEEGINSKACETTLNDSLVLENNIHGTDNFCGLASYISNDFNYLQPREFVEKIIGMSIEETEKKIEISFYLIGNNGVIKNNNFYFDEVTLTN